jgi:hypothetical protein
MRRVPSQEAQNGNFEKMIEYAHIESGHFGPRGCRKN